MDEMDECGKRTFDTPETQEPKRMRPEEIIGSLDDKKCTTRLLMSRQEFSKIIGKGGSTIMHIRTTCGASVKGSDVDAETRLVIITGTPRQVLEAFEIVSELMHQSFSQQASGEHFSIQLLLEHSKAGRVVGVKGATIQSLKMKSGAAQIRMQKDPREFSGVQLRVLTIEGQLPCVRRAHFFLQELFVDPSQGTAAAGGGVAYAGSYDGAGGYQAGAYGAGQVSQAVGVPLPLNSLTALGVQAETVRQLSEMKQYLSRQFGLDLSISREIPVGSLSVPSSPAIAGTYPQVGGVYSPGLVAAGSPARAHGPDDVTFSIPSQSVGGIIGKGGQMLKDLQTEYGIRIYVEKESQPHSGVRTVVLKSISSSAAGGGGSTQAERDAMMQCQERIVAMSQDPTILAGGIVPGTV